MSVDKVVGLVPWDRLIRQQADPTDCVCEFTADPLDEDENTPETAWHFLRECAHCGNQWFGLHCPHDGYQNPCPNCGKRPMPTKLGQA